MSSEYKLISSFKEIKVKIKKLKYDIYQGDCGEIFKQFLDLLTEEEEFKFCFFFSMVVLK